MAANVDDVKREFLENRAKDYAWLNAIEALEKLHGYSSREAENLVEKWDDEAAGA